MADSPHRGAGQVRKLGNAQTSTMQCDATSHATRITGRSECHLPASLIRAPGSGCVARPAMTPICWGPIACGTAAARPCLESTLTGSAVPASRGPFAGVLESTSRQGRPHRAEVLSTRHFRFSHDLTTRPAAALFSGMSTGHTQARREESLSSPSVVSTRGLEENQALRKSSSAALTSSGWVHAMLCGPPSTGTSSGP